MSDLTVFPVTVEHHREPVGIGESRPRLSWVTRTELADWRQAAYELEIEPEDGEVWSSGRIESAESVLVPWEAPELASRERRTVRVRVWGEGADRAVGVERGRRRRGRAAGAGRLVGRARPARAAGPEHEEPVLLLRREFVLDKPVARARLYATAHGVYEAELNGAVVGDHVLAPGWTAYEHRLRYQTFDVTDLLAEGPNAIGVSLADGWYRGYVGLRRQEGGLRRPARRVRAAGGRAPGRQPHHGDQRRLVAVDARPGDPGRHLQRRDRRPAAGAARLVGGGLRRRRLDAGRGRLPRRRDARRPHRPARPPDPGAAGAGDHDVAVRQDARRLRAEPRRPAAAARCPTRPRAPRSPCGTPRCSSTASWAPGRCGRPRRPTSSSSTANGRTDLGAAVHLPRLPLRRGERLARGADDRRPRGRRRAHRHAADRHVHVLGPGRHPAARERRLGHARQLRRRAHRLPAARRAARLDRRPRRLRADRRVPLRHRRHAAVLAGRPRRRAARGARRRRPDLRAVPRHRCRRASRRSRWTPAGATRPSSCRGRCTRRTGTPGCSPTSGTA